MDWMHFVSALVSALAWPSAVVVVVCLLRNSILGLIPKIRSFKYGELDVDLTEALQSLKEDLPPAPSEPEANPPKPRIEISVPLQIAAVSPRARIIAAWLEVESAFNEVLTREGGWNVSTYCKRERNWMRHSTSVTSIDSNATLFRGHSDSATKRYTCWTEISRTTMPSRWWMYASDWRKAFITRRLRYAALAPKICDPSIKE